MPTLLHDDYFETLDSITNEYEKLRQKAVNELSTLTFDRASDAAKALDTTEGAIAVLRQFGAEASRTGGDIKFLESTLDSINSVSISINLNTSIPSP